jgi:hypothetical protein
MTGPCIDPACLPDIVLSTLTRSGHIAEHRVSDTVLARPLLITDRTERWASDLWHIAVIARPPTVTVAEQIVAPIGIWAADNTISRLWSIARHTAWMTAASPRGAVPA